MPLAVATVIGAMVLLTVLLPAIQSEQSVEAQRFLAVLDIDQDVDGIADLYDRVKVSRSDHMPLAR